MDKKESIKTKFSKEGLLVCVLVFLPYAFSFIPTRYNLFAEYRSLPKWLLILNSFIVLFMVLTQVLVRNLQAHPLSSKSRIFSFANVILGVYYILWVYFYRGDATVGIYMAIKILASLYLIIFSFDRRNWVAFSLSLAYLVLSIATSSLALVRVYG